MTLDRQMIVEAARSYLDWGWRHQARGPRHIDCVGLPIMVARQLALVAPDFDFTGYSRESELDRLVAIFREHMPERARTAARAGDLVVTRDRLLPCHCGILGQKSYGLSLIHARATISRSRSGGLHKQGRVREEPYAPAYADLTTHCFVFPGVAD